MTFRVLARCLACLGKTSCRCIFADWDMYLSLINRFNFLYLSLASSFFVYIRNKNSPQKSCSSFKVSLAVTKSSCISFSHFFLEMSLCASTIDFLSSIFKAFFSRPLPHIHNLIFLINNANVNTLLT